MAIDNRACLKADLDAEHTAQHLTGSNTGGGHGFLSTKYCSIIPFSYTQILIKNKESVCREGKAVVLVAKPVV